MAVLLIRRASRHAAAAGRPHVDHLPGAAALRRRVILFAVAIAVVAAGCSGTGPQPAAISPDAAKSVAVDIVGARSVPRSIADITALLDQAAPDPARAAAARAKAAAEPPRGKSGSALADFYLERSKAAGEIGLIELQLADARRGVALIRESGGAGDVDDLADALLTLAFAERAAGN